MQFARWTERGAVEHEFVSRCPQVDRDEMNGLADLAAPTDLDRPVVPGRAVAA